MLVMACYPAHQGADAVHYFFFLVWSYSMLMLVCISGLDAAVLKAKPSPDILVGRRREGCNPVHPHRLSH